jgi:adenylyltransferase/sulfurtransferase
MFPALDEDSMPTCSIEGVHPSILSIIGGIEVAEAVKIITGKKPSLADKILHVDLENMDFVHTRTFKADECPVCGSGKVVEAPKEEMIIEELCGRNRGKRTFSLTPTKTFDLDVEAVTKIAKENNFRVENQGELGLSLRTNEQSVSFMKRGSAVIVGTKDEAEAVALYNHLIGRKEAVAKSR